MREIPLAKGRGVALVDDEDYEEISKYSWNLNVVRGYAQTVVWHGKKQELLKIHKVVAKRMGLEGKIDHKNRNRLDCRRENLRPATAKQNAANTPAYVTNKLGIKGVCKKKNRFRARIGVDGKVLHLGYFATAEEASDAYFKAAQHYFGEFACRDSRDPTSGLSSSGPAAPEVSTAMLPSRLSA